MRATWNAQCDTLTQQTAKSCARTCKLQSRKSCQANKGSQVNIVFLADPLGNRDLAQLQIVDPALQACCAELLSFCCDCSWHWALDKQDLKASAKLLHCLSEQLEKQRNERERERDRGRRNQLPSLPRSQQNLGVLPWRWHTVSRLVQTGSARYPSQIAHR